MHTKSCLGILAALVLSIAASGPALARKLKPETTNKANEDDSLRLYHPEVLNHTPKDLRKVQKGKPGTWCDVQGRPSQMSREDRYGNCITYTSPSTNTTWVVRYIVGGAAERVFESKDGRLELRAQFNAQSGQASSAPAGLQARGNQKTPVPVAANPAPAAPTAQIQDCSRFRGLRQYAEKLQCELEKNAAIAAGVKAGGRRP